MMKPLPALYKRLFLQMLLLLGCYQLSRWCFTLINHRHFPGLGAGEFLRLCFHALRYDISATLAVNAPYILIFLLPLPTWRWPRWERGTQILFVAINAFAFLFELGDWAYFPYNFKRSTADVLKMVSRKGDFLALLPRFLIDYWYVPLAWAAIAFLLWKINNRIRRATPLNALPATRRSWLLPLVQSAGLSLAAALCVLGIRGGFQYIPIGLRNAVQVTDSRYVPIVVNTPFSIITTYTTPGLEEVHYLPDSLVRAYINPAKQYRDRAFQPKNVVLIILESYSKEFTALGPGPSYTPFLDSLMSLSLNCTQAYANALHSAEGIPSIISGVPSLMEEAITTSSYGTNRITALPGLLREKGYQTAFYHGGTNGTMSFDVYAASAGFERYYGRTEYGNEQDYDGNWGIWDEPFLQFFAAGLGRMRQPFMASVFTLSSHPPYGVPDAYRALLPKGHLKVHPAVAYTDAALRRFFAAAARQPWFTNTLFVITADHCSPQTEGGYYETNMGQYAIPLLFYAPGDTGIRGSFSEPVQQLDILPSVLHYIGYDQPFFAFGSSIFQRGAPRYVINNISGAYQWLSDGYLLQTLEVQPKGLFAFPQDSSCAHNLLRRQPAAADSSLVRLKAFIQCYRRSLIRNQMYIGPVGSGPSGVAE